MIKRVPQEEEKKLRREETFQDKNALQTTAISAFCPLLAFSMRMGPNQSYVWKKDCQSALTVLIVASSENIASSRGSQLCCCVSPNTVRPRAEARTVDIGWMVAHCQRICLLNVPNFGSGVRRCREEPWAHLLCKASCITNDQQEIARANLRAHVRAACGKNLMIGLAKQAVS